MICWPCRRTRHHLCRRGTWCDCQHRDPVPGVVVQETETDAPWDGDYPGNEQGYPFRA